MIFNPATDVDLTGLTFDAAMAVVAADCNRTIAVALRRFRVEFIKQGARGDDLALLLDYRRDELETWRERCVAEMREWLFEEGGRTSH